mgnify:CR=1 FL=1
MRGLALIAVLSMPVLADVAPPPPAEPTVAAPATPVAAEHPGGNDKAPAAPMGVIEGGWAYVYAAWGAGVLGLIAYAASLFLRRSDAPPPGAP